ncbi:hypothetical protein V8C34DRAFT_281188 [Trichoderma compactum]
MLRREAKRPFIVNLEKIDFGFKPLHARIPSIGNLVDLEHLGRHFGSYKRSAIQLPAKLPPQDSGVRKSQKMELEGLEQILLELFADATSSVETVIQSKDTTFMQRHMMAQRKQIARLHGCMPSTQGRVGFSRELPSLECNQKAVPRRTRVVSLIEFKPCPKLKKKKKKKNQNTRIRMRKQTSDLVVIISLQFPHGPRAHDGLATASSTENLGPRILLAITDLSSGPHLGVSSRWGRKLERPDSRISPSLKEAAFCT